MKINITKILAPAVLFGSLFFATAAMAQTPACPINPQPIYRGPQPVLYQPNFYQQKRTLEEKLQNQKYRIAEGVRDGSITGKEAAFLHQQQINFQRELAAATNNRFISPAQYARFEAQLDQMSKSIYNAAHDADNNRPGYRFGANRPVNHPDFR